MDISMEYGSKACMGSFPLKSCHIRYHLFCLASSSKYDQHFENSCLKANGSAVCSL